MTAILSAAVILLYVAKTKEDADFLIYGVLLLAFLTLLNWLESTVAGKIGTVLFWSLIALAALMMAFLAGERLLGYWQALRETVTGLQGMSKFEDFIAAGATVFVCILAGFILGSSFQWWRNRRKLQLHS